MGRGPGNAPSTSLALFLTALILLIIANVYPFLTLRLQGQVESTTIVGAAHSLWQAGMWGMAILVLTTILLAPLLEILGSLYVLMPLHFGCRAPAAVAVFRSLERLRPWGMVEVYLLGTLVAVVKLASMATVEAGIGIYALGALIFAAAGAVATLDAEAVWMALDER